MTPPSPAPTSPVRMQLAIVPNVGLALCDADGRVLPTLQRVEVVNEVENIATVTATFAIDGTFVAWAEPTSAR